MLSRSWLFVFVSLWLSGVAAAESVPLPNGVWATEVTPKLCDRRLHDYDEGFAIVIDNDKIDFYELTCHVTDVMVSGKTIWITCDIVGEGVGEGEEEIEKVTDSTIKLNDSIFHKCP